jgi:TM2 domain-containing membrane protein YozV
MAKKVNPNFNPVVPLLALILAWILPGAGHLCLGRWKRGIIICITLGATFWAGIAIGGVMTVSPLPTERWWFVADMFTGVHGLAGWKIQQSVYQRVDGGIGPEVDNYLRTVSRASQVQIDGETLARVRADLVDRKLAEENLALTAPGDSVARAYCGVAGLLNLMCIFDAVILSLMGVRGEGPARAADESKEANL